MAVLLGQLVFAYRYVDITASTEWHQFVGHHALAFSGTGQLSYRTTVMLPRGLEDTPKQQFQECDNRTGRDVSTSSVSTPRRVLEDSYVLLHVSVDR